MAIVIKSKRDRLFDLSDEERANVYALFSTTTIERVPIDILVPYAKNVKEHPPEQIERVAESIRSFGFNQPILIGADHEIIAGHARVEAAKLLGLAEVLAIRLDHLTAAQKRALRIADNKLAELGGWNLDNLRSELIELTSSELELEFDHSVLGFETVEIDQIIVGDKIDGKHDPADELPRMPIDEPVVTQPGDIWVCDEHRLLCGNSLLTSSYEELLGRERTQIGLTDPPYNVPNQGHVTKRANVREFSMAAGDLTEAQYTAFLSKAFTCMATCLNEGAVIYVFMDHRHLDELSAATRPLFGKPKNMIVWVKPNAGLASFYRSQHEIVNVYVKGPTVGVNNFKLGARGRHRSNIWRYPGMNSFGRDRDALLALHPTVKPVALIADALRDCSHRGDIVLDPFAGSGTTMMAAERTGRRARLIELDPLYCDAVVKRWQQYTGKDAYHFESSESFREVALRRTTDANGRGAISE